MSLRLIAGRFNKEEFYKANGFSRQFLYKKRKARSKSMKIENDIVSAVKETRIKHRNMGARVMYHQLKIEEVGINKFEKIVSNNGLSVQIRRRRIVTTDGYYENWDENLINGMVLNNINQVIAGDITYLILKNKTYYIFSLKDMYSKRIVGLYGSENMFAENALTTLRQVFKLRGESIHNCIHHSDAGSQYKSNTYKKALKQNKLKMSIAENCLQNGMAEQLNGVLKNDYIIKEVKNVKELNRQLTKIKTLINEERPVKQLGYMTPVAFEKSLMTNDKNMKIELYNFENQNGGTFERHNNKKSLVN
jgi:transposase InsO family protein